MFHNNLNHEFIGPILMAPMVVAPIAYLLPQMYAVPSMTSVHVSTLSSLHLPVTPSPYIFNVNGANRSVNNFDGRSLNMQPQQQSDRVSWPSVPLHQSQSSATAPEFIFPVMAHLSPIIVAPTGYVFMSRPQAFPASTGTSEESSNPPPERVETASSLNSGAHENLNLSSHIPRSKNNCDERSVSREEVGVPTSFSQISQNQSDSTTTGIVGPFRTHPLGLPPMGYFSASNHQANAFNSTSNSPTRQFPYTTLTLEDLSFLNLNLTPNSGTDRDRSLLAQSQQERAQWPPTTTRSSRPDTLRVPPQHTQGITVRDRDGNGLVPTPRLLPQFDSFDWNSEELLALLDEFLLDPPSPNDLLFNA